MNPELMKGLVVKHIDCDGKEQLQIETVCGRQFLFQHIQDCCEGVWIDTVEGDLKKLEGYELISVDMEEEWSETREGRYVESCPQTDVIFKTTKDTVIVKWIGESNGYYSESVDLRELT